MFTVKNRTIHVYSKKRQLNFDKTVHKHRFHFKEKI